MSEIRDRSVVKSSVIPSAKYCWSGSLLRLVKGSTTIDRRGATRGCEIAVGPTATAVGVGAFLYALLPEILERVGQLVANVVAYRPRDADAAGLGERFQPRRDVDAGGEDVVKMAGRGHGSHLLRGISSTLIQHSSRLSRTEWPRSV